MKKIDTSFDSTTAGMTFKTGVLNHLLQAYQEMITAISQTLVGNYAYNAAVVYVLSGCIDSGSGLAHTITAGYIYFNGEIYQVDAISFVSTGSNVPVGILQQTFATSAIGDPVEFTDGSTHNILQIRKCVIASQLTGTGSFPDFSQWVRCASATVWNQYISAFGVAYTMKFTQDQSVFFTTGILASISATLSFDLIGAIPGTVVVLKIQMNSAGSCAVTAPGGVTLINQGGAMAPNKINIVTCEYVGINELGNPEIRYSVNNI